MVVYTCPKCGGKDLQFSVMTTYPQLEHFNVTECSSCGWREEKREGEIKRIPYKATFYPPCQDCNTKMDEIRRIYDKIYDKLQNQESSNKDVLDKVRAEIVDRLKALDEIEKSGLNIYLPNEMSGRRVTYQQCLEFIDKYKVESEN